MSPTPIENAAFRVTFTETNLRYLLDAETPDKAAVARCKKQLNEARQNLKQLKKLS
jgi:5-bromo-4-chloroindolyl phosphate hydrolysis protein